MHQRNSLSKPPPLPPKSPKSKGGGQIQFHSFSTKKTALFFETGARKNINTSQNVQEIEAAEKAEKAKPMKLKKAKPKPKLEKPVKIKQKKLSDFFKPKK